MAEVQVVAAKKAKKKDWSVELEDSDKVIHGGNVWWNSLLKANKSNATKDKYPFTCRLNCGHLYTSSSANATRVYMHVVGGNSTGISSCVKVYNF